MLSEQYFFGGKTGGYLTCCWQRRCQINVEVLYLREVCSYLLYQIEYSNSITDRREKASSVRGKNEITFAVDGTQQIGELVPVSEYLGRRGPHIP